jgi:hypothetical protein
MKKIFLLTGILTLLISSSFGQKKAVTETGEEVILYTNGTWKYLNDSVAGESEIKINPKAFKKSANATFLIKSTKFNIGLWVDSKKWSFKKAVSNEDAEYELQLKGKDLYGMMLTESIELPLESMKSVALSNARSSAADAQVVKEEYRTVNNKRILMMQINGTTQGMKFSYYGYYFSSSKGTVQLVTYTAQNLLPDYLNEIEELLNGLVTVE